jgi:hypothetical protein
VANIPEEEFEDAIESDDPVTLTALAERGTVKKSPFRRGRQCSFFISFKATLLP